VIFIYKGSNNAAILP